MAIGADSGIIFVGTQDSIASGTAAIADGAYGAFGTTWTNDDDAPYAAFVLNARFTTTMPTIGSLDLYDRLHNVQGTNEEAVPDANYRGQYLGSFPIDFGVAAGTYFYSVLPNVELPVLNASQIHEFYLHNNGTGQSVTNGWNVYVTPFTIGPHP